MPYSQALQNEQTGKPSRELCIDPQRLRGILVDALRAHPARPPPQAPALSNSLQGNLAEFAVWDLGERRWLLYDRAMSWTANADSPWKASSDPGADILAISAGPDPRLILVEVKSSINTGVSLVDGQNSLKEDFDRLFEGAVQQRLHVLVGKVLSALRFVHKRGDLVDSMRKLIGSSPTECVGVQLHGVLVCSSGEPQAAQARSKAFQRLEEHLTSLGWPRNQIVLRTVEVPDLKQFLVAAIQEACA